MVLKKNQPGYSEAKDKNGKTYWKKTEQGGRAASLDGSIVSDALSDFDTNDAPVRDPQGDRNAYRYLLQEKDIDSLINNIDEQETPDDVQYTYDSMKHACNMPLAYDEIGEKIIMAYAHNENTPDKVLQDMLKVGNYYHDIFNGIHKDAVQAIGDNPNASDETLKIIEDNKQKWEDNTKRIEETRAVENKAQAAFKDDPDLENRLSSVREQGIGSRRTMQFNPEDVEKAGVDWVMRNKVKLFGAQYNEQTGVVTGYID